VEITDMEQMLQYSVTLYELCFQLPGKVRKIDISVSGSGFAVVQVSYRYNLNVTGAWPLFTLDPQVDKNSDGNHLQLSICSG
jgi:CD109 antigen